MARAWRGEWMLPAAALAVLACLTAACTPPGPSNAVARGHFVYVTNCTACHNLNPNLPGPIGPAIAGSSELLVKARVLHLAYPPSYQPKRPTHLMRAFPQLAPEIGALTAFLQAAARDPSNAALPETSDPSKPPAGG